MRDGAGSKLGFRQMSDAPKLEDFGFWSRKNQLYRSQVLGGPKLENSKNEAAVKGRCQFFLIKNF